MTQKPRAKWRKQGRRPLPPGLVSVPITVFALPAQKERLKVKARQNGMTLSAYCGLALSVGDRQLSTADNW